MSGNIGDNTQVDEIPSYEDDQATFEAFIKEHQITISSNRNQNNSSSSQRQTDEGIDDDDNVLFEPSSTSSNLRNIPCYTPLLQRIKNRQYYESISSHTFIIEIPLSELVAWDSMRGMDLATKATNNTLRYVELFCNVIDSIIDSMAVTTNHVQRDSIDILHEQRLTQQQQQQQQQNQEEANNENQHLLNQQLQNNDAIASIPPVLLRRYELRILPLGRKGTLPPFSHQYHITTNGNYEEPTSFSIRHVRSQSMGKLVTIKAMVVRSSDVKPSIQVATYICHTCGCEIYQVITSKKEFLPLKICPSPECKKSGPQGIQLQTRGSKFTKFQEWKVQELPSQVPVGHVPRSWTVHCRGELTRMSVPGDIVTLDGIFLPQKVAEGYRGRMMGNGLISTTYLEVQNAIVHKKSYEESELEHKSDEERKAIDDAIMEIALGEDPILKLSSSIAPEIFGHEDIKRALLLQLVGGCTRKLPDGMRIRGDINICLMGDPGVAKSQLLKHVASIAPRGVYTTGKGSSGVGLTAAISKDSTTGEMCLEGGALVLADQGICAIDEFDKMDEADRTAIHEVMEQQSVSIAKAGIVASLNARAAVLAAANPLYGRYNKKKSLSENINLPNSLLSRFDLMFLILDVADVDHDMALARHVTFVHQNEGLESKSNKEDISKALLFNEDEDDKEDDDEDDVPTNIHLKSKQNPDSSSIVSSQILREYISRARRFQPVIPPEVSPYIVEAYVGLRMQNSNGRGQRFGGNTASDQTVMTARQLLSMLRMSQALARLRFSDYVAREDVDEAIRITHMSKASLNSDEDGDSRDKNNNKGQDVKSRIYSIIKDYTSASRADRVELKVCEAMVLRKGFTVQQLQSCLEEYQDIGVLQINNAGTHIHFI